MSEATDTTTAAGRPRLKRRPGTGGVYANGKGFYWAVKRNGKLYRGLNVATREEAFADLQRAVADLPAARRPTSRPCSLCGGEGHYKNGCPDNPAPPPQRILAVHSVTIPNHRRLNYKMRAALAVLVDGETYPDVERPRTRGDCASMPRPCPFVSCEHHLFLEVTETGGLKLNFPGRQVHELSETCSLDVADRGGLTLDAVGTIVNLTRERIRQVEVRSLLKIKNHTGNELALPDDREAGGFRRAPAAAAP